MRDGYFIIDSDGHVHETADRIGENARRFYPALAQVARPGARQAVPVHEGAPTVAAPA